MDKILNLNTENADKSSILLNVIQHLLEEVAELKQKLRLQEKGKTHLKLKVDDIHSDNKCKADVANGDDCKYQGYGAGGVYSKYTGYGATTGGNGAGGDDYQYKGYGAGGDDYCYQGAGGCRRNIDVHKCCNGKQCSSTNMKNLRSCRYCGLVHKFGSANCKAFGKSCNKCKKMNHFSRVCRSRKNPKDIETEIESEEAIDVEQTNVEEVKLPIQIEKSDAEEKGVLSKAAGKRRNRKKKRIILNDVDDKTGPEVGECASVEKEDDAEKVDNNDKEFNLNCEELQKKFSMMENPCFHDGRWQEYMEMSQVQRDLHDKQEFEEEQKLRRALGLL